MPSERAELGGTRNEVDEPLPADRERAHVSQPRDENFGGGFFSCLVSLRTEIIIYTVKRRAKQQDSLGNLVPISIHFCRQPNDPYQVAILRLNSGPSIVTVLIEAVSV